MSRIRDIAKFLGKTEETNTTNVALAQSGEGVTVYTTLDSLPSTGLTSGDQAWVESSGRLYISNGSGWYNIALVNATPTLTLDQSGTIILNADTLTVTVTASATDSDDNQDMITFSVESDGNMVGTGTTVSQDSSVFTITALSEDSGGTAGDFTLTFKATDGIAVDNENLSFSLAFSNVIDSSAGTILLMKARGSTGSDNATITFLDSDNSSQDFTETNAPQASTFSPYRSGGYSAYFDGSGDQLTVASSSDFAYGTGNFTIEGWMYPEKSGSWQQIVGHDGYPSSGSGVVWFGNDDKLYWYQSGSAGGNMASANTLNLNEWTHFAIVREGTGTDQTKMYINGVESNTMTSSTNYAADGLELGWNQTYPYQGYMRDIRITKGVAVYTADFTPPTESLTADSDTSLLICHLPYFGDGSTSNHSITVNGNASIKPFGPYNYEPFDSADGGSLFTSTVNSYVSSSLVPQVGSTGVAGHLEYWFYPISTSATGFVHLGNNMNSNSAYVHWVDTDNDLTVQTANSASALMTWSADGSGIAKNTWNHIWIQKDASNDWDAWINGKHLGNVTSSYGNTHTGAVIPQIIGAGYSSTYGGTQFIADMKIATDIKSNTDDFTPPTAPLSHDASTTFLMNNKSDANVYDAAAGSNFRLTGNVATSTAQRKFTTSSSITFDGNGDYVELSKNYDDPRYLFGTEDFTIEFWYRSNGSLGGSKTLVSFIRNNDGSDNNHPYIYLNGNNIFYWTDGTNRITTSGNPITNNTWQHIALTRSGNDHKLFVDGTQVGSTWTNAADYTQGRPTIAQYNKTLTTLATVSYLQGYMQDLRITKGYARYTANFTPPTAEFEL